MIEPLLPIALVGMLLCFFAGIWIGRADRADRRGVHFTGSWTE